MNHIIAIDTGNGFGKVAWLETAASAPVFLLDASLPGGMPTTAYVTPDGKIEVHKNITKRLPGRAVYNVKTHFDKPHIECDDNGIKYFADPGKVYAAVTLELIKLANEELRKRNKEPSYQIVLTYPASFINTDKPAIMKKSVEELTLDGKNIEVVAMLPEPSAAAIDAMHEKSGANDKKTEIKGISKIVYDLGHGTFDAVLVTYTGDKNAPFDAIEHNADPEIGGRIFDKKIADAILRQLGFPAEYTPTPNDSDLIEHSIAVKMKHTLSDNNTAFENFFKTGAAEYSELSLTQESFRKMIINDINTTHAKLFELLETAEKTGLNVDEIILTGGSCNIPFIKEYLEQVLKDKGISIPVNRYKPECAVVFGAARYAFHYGDKKKEAEAPEKPTKSPKSEKPEKDKEPKKISPVKVIKQHLESDYCIRAENTAYKLIDRSTVLPASSEEIKISCHGATAEIIVYCTRKGKKFSEAFNREVFTEVRRFNFDVYPHNEVTIRLTVDDNRFAKIICKAPNGNIIKEH